MERIKIKNSKGQSIAAVVDYTAKPYNRLAILCPGYLDTKDYAHLAALATRLTEKGYTVVRFDPTGTWESEGNISEYTTTQYLADIEYVLDYMVKKDGYSYVLLGGHSRGGQVSILFAAGNPKINAVLGLMPSLGRVEKSEREEWKNVGVRISKRDLPGDRTQTTEFKVPFSHRQDREQYDTLEAVKKIHAPIVLVAGELDDIVEPNEVKEIFDKANEPKRFVLIEGIGHDYRLNDTEIAKVNSRIIESLFPFILQTSRE